MSAVAIETFRPVRFDVARLQVTAAAEILREPLREAELVRRLRLPFLREVDDLIRMASGKSATAGAWVKNHLLGQVAITAFGTVYFGLWTTTAGTDLDAYVGNTAGEVSGGSYDRVSKANNTTNFATITGDNAKVNSNAITWTTASANWNSSSVIPQLLIFDGNAKTAADNLVLWGDFTTAKAVLSGDTAQINTSSLSYTDE
jgi:hypothetical protein